MCKIKSYRGGMMPMRNFTDGSSCIWRKIVLAVGLAAGVAMGTSAANAAESLWISAPNWSYSAAAADSPAGWAYFWGLSVGANTYSFAYAFSNDGVGDAAYAFAVASANSFGGYGAVDAVGFADPYSGIDINDSFGHDSIPGDYPTSKPGSDPLTSAYTVSDSGISFNSESSSELNGSDGLQAFLYTGGTDQSSLDTLLGATGTGGNTSAGDISSITALEGLGSLTALDPVISDPSSNNGITFTNPISNTQQTDVILVGFENAASAPVPASLSLSVLGLFGLGSLALMRRARGRLRT
jgi:hypothetical protein